MDYDAATLGKERAQPFLRKHHQLVEEAAWDVLQISAPTLAAQWQVSRSTDAGGLGLPTSLVRANALCATAALRAAPF
eukprot:703685-Alexandrium_andersonii.AAC.1